MGNLAGELRELHFDEDATIEINILNPDGLLKTPQAALDETSNQPSSAEVLARVLEERAHLNLTGTIFVEPLAIMKKHGGAADVFEGIVIKTRQKVAVKRLRLNIGGDEKIAKVRLL